MTPNQSQSPSRFNVLGVQVHALNMQKAVEEIDAAIQAQQKGYICVSGVHGVMEAQEDTTFKNILNSAFLNVPDGMPLVWVGKLSRIGKFDAKGARRGSGQDGQKSRLQKQEIGRVYGPDLMLEVCKMSLAKGYTHFFYGGKPGVAEELRQSLTERFPGLRIVGTYTPPFRPLNEKEEADLIQQVSHLKPDLFWVGLSTPKQERFSAQYLPRLETKIMLGVGAAFDLHTGRMKDAPGWVKKIGMQWFHRMIQEPRRLSKRYLRNNPKFLYKISRQLLAKQR